MLLNLVHKRRLGWKKLNSIASSLATLEKASFRPEIFVISWLLVEKSSWLGAAPRTHTSGVTDLLLSMLDSCWSSNSCSLGTSSSSSSSLATSISRLAPGFSIGRDACSLSNLISEERRGWVGWENVSIGREESRCGCSLGCLPDGGAVHFNLSPHICQMGGCAF